MHNGLKKLLQFRHYETPENWSILQFPSTHREQRYLLPEVTKEISFGKQNANEPQTDLSYSSFRESLKNLFNCALEML